MKIRLHGIEESVTTLGPGTRFVVWVQGCHRRCPGCMTPESRIMDGGFESDTEILAEQIIKRGLTGLTISGGEPFLQAAELVDLIERVRMKQDLGVIIYTGNTLEELKESSDKAVHELLSRCDLLIDGPYEETLNDGKGLRGSSNQRAIPLTSRYEEEASAYGTTPARIELFIHDGETRMVGIPTKDMLKRFDKIKW